jgi:hypothetical protein
VYNLTCYNADGAARDLEFVGRLDLHDVYPPGTYIRVSASKTWATGKEALPETDVPAAALAKIKESYAPSSASTLSEYAAEQTQRLSSRNTPSLTITCEAGENSLVYTYLYGAKTLADSAAEFLDPVYKSQFRADQDSCPELGAIFLEIKLEDGETVFSQKYDERVKFGYELD